MDVRDFPWVANEAKALRAVVTLKKEGKEVTEEAIKALYIKYGGLCVGQPETQLGVPEGEISLAVLTVEEKEKVVEEENNKKNKRNKR